MQTTTKPRRTRSGGIRRAGAIALAALLALAAFWWWRADWAPADQGYRTTVVERGDIRVAISATGTLSAISTVTVGSQVSGQVTEVLVDFNDKVRQGQVIARIDPSTYEAQIEQGNAQVASARAQLRQAQAALANAEADYRRKAALADSQLVARSDVDLARAARDQAQAQVASAQAQIRQQSASTQTTRVNLGRTVIRSPVDGVVITRSVEPGQTVAASLQAPELFVIAEDLSKMKIELAVDEADIGQVREGQQVSFTADAFPDRRFRGVVDQVRLAATTTANVVTYPVVVTVDNSDGTLLPGLTVNAEIEVSKREGVLKVANAALRYKPAQPVEGAPAAGSPRGSGVGEDLARAAEALQLDDRQRAALDAALEAIRERQAARQAAPATGNGSSLFGGGGARRGGAGGGGAAMQGQFRQRMLDRFRQDFAGFRDTLDDAQKAQWERIVADLVGATRAPLYLLVDGQPRQVMVRVGASDGSDTEISGPVEAGDVAITGERAAQ
ncbi:efflux RND transporter periplasmic adaptor subunit [Cognatiluteimonas lumbrici]|uniref:efflux RND transporter periplasmic adaptor subunit n=1 Tax=Cognatiluteimonas lumbrici TaxID=2559601 RepID=UPI001128F753|nr:efflux RND transporter periplasmic adaptor subunit [Luteimonas lumbrici]